MVSLLKKLRRLPVKEDIKNVGTFINRELLPWVEDIVNFLQQGGTEGPQGPPGPEGPTGPTGATGADNPSHVVHVLSASSGVTNSTSNVSFGVYTIPANDPIAEDVYRCTGHCTWDRTPALAAVGPSLICELLLGGSVVATSTMVNGLSGDDGNARIGFNITGYLTFKTVGASGTVDAYIGSYHNYGFGKSEISTVADDAADSTGTLDLEMRVRLSNTAATNTLTARQGFYELLRQ